MHLMVHSGGYMMIILWISIISILVAAIIWLSNPEHLRSRDEKASDIIDRKYVNGEISYQEYIQLKRHLI